MTMSFQQRIQQAMALHKAGRLAHIRLTPTM